MATADGAFRVGVTGHRRLAAAESLVEPLDGALAAAERAARGRPLVLVSALAEGADRLAAHRALRRDGWSLEVVLPLDRADYESDFPDSVDEFRQLVEAAAAVTTHTDRARPDAYLAAGLDVVTRADMLIALWDGRPAEGAGGTAEIVDAARARRIPVLVVPATRALAS